MGAGPGGSVVRTIIALAGTFGMTTVAEGVETAAQLQMLSQLGCHQSQGYLHSPAVPAAEFTRMLAAGSLLNGTADQSACARGNTAVDGFGSGLRGRR